MPHIFFEYMTPTIVKKELSPHIIIDTIRNFNANQYEYTFCAKPDLIQMINFLYS